MNLNRQEFLSAMKKAMPGVESGNVILQGADAFIFHDGFIHTYNDTISVSVHFPITNKAGENVSAAIKAKDFYNLISRYESDTILIIPKDDVWVIKSENTRAELTLLENNVIDHIQGIMGAKFKWQPIPERFFEGMQICNFNSKSQLSGLYCVDKVMVSADELKVNWYELNDAFSGSFWINTNAVTELLKLQNPKKYFVSDAWVHFMTEDKTIFSCKRLAQDNYPFDKISTLITSHKKDKNDVSNELPSKLIDAVNRAAALSQNIDSFDTVKLTFTTDNIEVFSQRPSGKYTETVAWEKPFKKDISPVTISVDYSMIQNGIKYSKSFYLKCLEVGGKIRTRVIFVSEHGLQLISTFDASTEE
jgi:hypothetical protein